MVKSSSLNSRVSYQQVLPLLDVVVPTNSLKTIVTCPVCRVRNRLYVYHDTATEGEWAYCRECRFAGDMIRLAQRVWKLDLRETIARLIKHGCFNDALLKTATINFYEDLYNRQQKYLKFWAVCKKNHITASPSLRVLQKRFHVQHFPGWESRLGDLVGGASRRELNECLRANYRLFSKTRWDNALVIPFQDLPGRLCGFLLIVRDGNPETDWSYYPLMYQDYDGGVAMLSALLRGPHPRLGNSKFLFTDPDIVIRMQARTCEQSQRPLPLAAAWDDQYRQTRRIFDCLPRTDLVVWGTKLIDAISCARAAEAKVSIFEASREELNANMRNYSPEEWLLRIRQRAVPWEVALRQLLQDCPEHEAEEVFARLGMQSRELVSFINECPPELHERLKYITKNPMNGAKIHFEGHWISEKEDGWYLERTGERITNAIIRIEDILTTRDKRSYYRGHIKFNGQMYPFVDSEKNIARGVMSWCARFLRDDVKAGICEYHSNWSPRIIKIALMFHTPECKKGVDMLGWDNDQRQFNFPGFIIRSGGELRNEQACFFDTSKTLSNYLQSPVPIPKKHRQALSELNDETQIVWAVAACLISSVIARAVNRNPVTTLLDGHGSQQAGASALSQIGCLRFPDGVSSRRRAASLTANLRKQHNWPLLIAPPINTLVDTWQENDHGDFIVMGPTPTRILGIRGTYQMVCHPRKLGSAQLTKTANQYIVVNYIHDLCRRNLLMDEDSLDLTQNVLTDLRDWFERCQGDPKAVEQARDILRTPYDYPVSSYFAELLFQLYEAGKLSFERHEFMEDKRTPAILQTKHPDRGECTWISQDQFSDAATAAGALTPDLLLITRTLAEQKILLDEIVHDRQRGWLVAAKWWTDELRKWRAHV